MTSDEHIVLVGERTGKVRVVRRCPDPERWNKELFEGMQHYYAASAHEEAHEYGKQLCRLTYATNRVAEAVLLTLRS